ncbi:prostasin-like [Gigantopelta aegis]|uniref:prostasin-like n=1 Tax=Gigantopelta aegis TaxID=1735272 RepID=UPI001B889EAE|nr:prostasin-like [Gigantopelta aegis]
MDYAINIFVLAVVAGVTSTGTSTCGVPKIQPTQTRIVGGHEARSGSLPWMAMLAELNYPVCGGAVISDHVILTAAHCFETPESRDPRRWTVVLGKHHVDRYDVTQRSYHVRRIVMHENYNNHTVRNDVALVVLWERIRYSDYISPICLPKLNRNMVVGKSCLIAGWGDTLGTSKGTVLNQVNVPIIGDHVCSQPTWYGNQFLPMTTFCAGYKNGGKDACAGDSGSPLACSVDGKWYVHGIASWGYGCAEPRWPGIYTDVTVYTHWIRQSIANLGYPSCSGYCI